MLHKYLWKELGIPRGASRISALRCHSSQAHLRTEKLGCPETRRVSWEGLTAGSASQWWGVGRGEGKVGLMRSWGAYGQSTRRACRARVVRTPNPQEVALKPRPDEIKQDQAR